MAEPFTISVASREYVPVPISAEEAGAAVAVSGLTVEMGFTQGSAAPSTWNATTIDTDATTTPSTYRAMCLVGPSGTITLTTGLWHVWVKVTDSPELVVREARGLLKVV